LGEAEFYIDYENKDENFNDELIAEVEARLRELASQQSDLVGAAVSITVPGQGETQFLYQARVVVYARPEDMAAVKKEDTPEGAMKAALDAIERQVREKREKLGQPWKRDDLGSDTQ